MAVSTNIKEKFDKVSQLFSFLDTTDWTDSAYNNPTGNVAIDTSVDILVICKINVNDSTTDHYKNAGYDTNSFTAQNFTIDASTTPNTVTTSTTETIGLPYNSNLEVVQGEYTIDYKIQATDTNGDTFVLEAQNEYNYLFDDPKPNLSVNVNCGVGTFTVEDKTQLVVDNESPSTTSRELKVTFPSDVSASPITTSNTSLVLTSFYTNTQQVDLSLTLNYVFTNFDVQTKVTAHEDVEVNCDSNLCDLYCCLQKLYEKMEYARCKDRTDYNFLEEKYRRALYLASLIKNAESCAKNADINKYISDLKEITNCNGDCNCNGQTSQNITSTGVTSIVSPFPSRLQFTSAGDTSRTVTSLIGKTEADFIVYDGDGNTIPPSSFNTATGEITFSYTIVSGLKYWVHILN